MLPAASAPKFKLQLVPELPDSKDPLFAEEKAVGVVFNRITEFVESLSDEYLTVEPWLVFNAWLDSRFNPTSKSIGLFKSWQFFHWLPDPGTVNNQFITQDTPTIAAAYLKHTKIKHSTEELAILESANKQLIDLYEIVGNQNGYLILYGTINRSKISVFNSLLSTKAQIGEHLIANVMPVDSQRYVILGASELLTASSKKQITEFCDFVRRCESSQRTFKNFESDLFNLLYDLQGDQALSL